MALQVMSWDLPVALERPKAYGEKTKTDWIPTILKQPGVQEFRGYRNPNMVSSEVIIHIKFDSMSSLIQYLASEDVHRILADLKASGATNLATEIWDASPIVPDQLRPCGR